MAEKHHKKQQITVALTEGRIQVRNLDLRLQIGDLLLSGGNSIGAAVASTHEVCDANWVLVERHQS